MTDDGTQRRPGGEILKTDEPQFGHRKLSAGLATLLGGQVAGQAIVQWIWDVISANAMQLGVDLPPMSPDVATSLFTLLAAWIFYKTREETVT